MSSHRATRGPKSHLNDLNRPYPCGICGARFTRREHLIRHASSLHRPPQLQCPVCPTVCSRDDNLRSHVRMMHPSVHNAIVAAAAGAGVSAAVCMAPAGAVATPEVATGRVPAAVEADAGAPAVAVAAAVAAAAAVAEERSDGSPEAVACDVNDADDESVDRCADALLSMAGEAFYDGSESDDDERLADLQEKLALRAKRPAHREETLAQEIGGQSESESDSESETVTSSEAQNGPGSV
ncbi:MAG: hypothetical protein M1832_006371 [Thelocarpon impressellum]|nr:MAG: hypothetical protein M1832_006371 [Thelocarpon impressellum]